MLVGSKEQIAIAKELRKGFGGGWRQAGLLAACGIYAIDHQWQRMKEDHEVVFTSDNYIHAINSYDSRTVFSLLKV